MVIEIYQLASLKAFLKMLVLRKEIYIKPAYFIQGDSSAIFSTEARVDVERRKSRESNRFKIGAI